MDKRADPIVFGSEYTPIADPQSWRTAPALVTRDEDACRRWICRAEGEAQRLRAIAAAQAADAANLPY
ncbi:hypothetical protein ACFVYD_36715 [Streptomyces sp. NPDC058301]|uniref:hypothetical protein n=1 Tax=Streptomyces sp. NPDC058301 TaxID=3346436 RepID=UPI0036F0906E